MASAALWPYFKELLFIFRVCRALRSAPNAFSQKGLLQKMPFAVANPSREKAILENPQIFQNCKYKNIFSAEDG